MFDFDFDFEKYIETDVKLVCISFLFVHWLRSWLCTGRQSRPGLVFQLVGSDLVHDPMAVSQAKDSQLFCLQAQAFDSKVATAIAKSTSDCSQQGIGNCKAQNQAIAQAVQEAIATVSLPDLLSCPFSCTSSHALIKENMPWRRQCVLASTMRFSKLPLILNLAVNRRRKIEKVDFDWKIQFETRLPASDRAICCRQLQRCTAPFEGSQSSCHKLEKFL